MDCYLFVDFGSTYTKITIVDALNEEVVLTAKDITTIETDIMIGYNNAYAKIADKLADLNITIVKKLGCSSAAGGLKIVAIGLVPELTSEAAKRAALGAGGKILGTYSYELTKSDVEHFLSLKPEIILLSGGTDGGNKEIVLHNARLLCEYDIRVPIIIACNKNAHEEIIEMFDSKGFIYYETENVMPKLNEINVDPVRNIIREVFMKNIVKAKGLENAVKFIGDILMPTPSSVLLAANTLSTGTDTEDGLGDLIIADIGGATTDIHSLCIGFPSKGGVMMKGLEEPFAKRSVEGDLGMRYSVQAAYEAATYRGFKKYLDDSYTVEDVVNMVNERSDDIEYIPSDERNIKFDEAIAKVCLENSLTRHAGKIEITYSPFGAMYSQYGKDLMNVKYLIGTGGVLVHSKNARDIMKSCCYDENDNLCLKPVNPNYLLDQSYILSAMGLLSTFDADKAIRIMKKYLMEC